MKIGDQVNYYDPSTGERQNAEVVAIGKAGDSLAKHLDLKVGDSTVEDVAHGADAEEGQAFWLVKGQESAPKGWAEGNVDIEPEYSPAPIKEAKEATKSTRKKK